MGYFIQQTLELKYQNNGLFYSTVTRTKDISAIGSFILQSLELRKSKQWFLLFNSH